MAFVIAASQAPLLPGGAPAGDCDSLGLFVVVCLHLDF